MISINIITTMSMMIVIIIMTTNTFELRLTDRSIDHVQKIQI